MSLLILDNYDSFTYNLVQLLRELGYGSRLVVKRNDKISLPEIDRFDKILLSPGPGIPSEAGIMPELIRSYAPMKRILGICLGHQGIAECFGAELYNLSEVLHGVSLETEVVADDQIFKGMPLRFAAGRYHSWAVKPDSLNGELSLIARDATGEVMGIRHKKYDVVGLQFHPESVLTEYGKEMLGNWMRGSE